MEALSSQHQIYGFDDEVTAPEVSISTTFDDTYTSTVRPNESLEDFFKRPIPIATYDWSTTAELSAVFNPWQRYFEDAKVQNRMANFNLASGTLCVKVLVNGNPFYFGRAMMFYNPLRDADIFSEGGTVPVVFKNVLRSQRPHIFIDPTESTAGCMELPFFWPYNALSIPNRDWENLGKLQISELSALRHANGATDPIHITVFAWFKELHLSAPTTDQFPLSAQSGTDDEYGEGIVSDAAAAVSAVAGSLATAPVIGPYARATEMAASGVGKIAKAFGYSRPTDLGCINRMLAQNFGEMAVTSGDDQLHKLTYDPKSEVTIDPKVTGINAPDEMSLKYLCQKESYVTSVLWGSADPQNLKLAEMLVTPQLYNLYGPTGAYAMTSMCHATLPFTYWRGTIKFRLQIVASKFHKGRLQISWDPSYFKSDYRNVIYTQIVDISRDRDITFEVGWGQPRSYAPLDDPDGTVPFRLRTSSYTSHSDFTNGVLQIRVLNPLAVATDASLNNDVDINIFASAGDDFEVMSPRGPPPMSPFEPQSSDVANDTGGSLIEPVMPETSPTFELGASVQDKSHLIYHSDPVFSLRQILKRYTSCYAIPLEFDTADAGFQRSTYRLSAMPPPYGYNSQAIYTTAGLLAFSYFPMNNLMWYSLAYMGYRGSLRHKIMAQAVNPDGTYLPCKIIAFRSAESDGIAALGNRTTGDITKNFSGQAALAGQIVGGHSGLAMSDVSLNSQLTVEIPYIRNSRFCIYRDNKLYDPAASLTGHPSFVVAIEASRAGTPTEPTQAYAHTYVSTGEDFSLIFHVGPPFLYYQNPPAPIA